MRLTAFSLSGGLCPSGRLSKADIKMKDISGQLVSLKEAKGNNGLLVMFTCNTCPYVIKNQARTKEICHYAINNKLG